MISMIAALLGGVGIFLVGMILLAEGLKAAAGDALRSILGRFTGTPLAGIGSGAAVSALVQSSSATTLTTIGFVSAGLLTFPQAVGVIIGSNLGTTSTGWIVSLLGLRLQVGLVALPLIGVGAVLRLISGGRRAHLGMALAGFGLIFVGIDTLQAGMASLAERIDPGSFPQPTVLGSAILLAAGVVMTVVMQSSSAAVATTLTALHAGTLDLHQAALLVVGQNLGTTVKAALAAVGASVPAKRTAVAHIGFNVVTAALAVAAVPLLVPFLGGLLADDPAVAVAAFHTVFNLLGVMIVLPVLRPFSRAVEALVPEREMRLTRHLDRSVAEVPAVAVEAARRAVTETADVVLDLARDVVVRGTGGAPDRARRVERARAALNEVRRFLSLVRTPPDMADDYARHLRVLHASDHLDRLLDALEAGGGAPALGLEAETVKNGEEPAARMVELVLEGIDLTREALATQRGAAVGKAGPDVAERMERLSSRVADLRKTYRATTLAEAAGGERLPADAFARVDRVRWMDRLGYHTWRTIHHLRSEELDGVGAPDPSPTYEETSG